MDIRKKATDAVDLPNKILLKKKKYIFMPRTLFKNILVI
jgi:hypothetical protein